MTRSGKFGTTLAAALSGMLLAMVLTAAAHAEMTQDFHRTVPLTANGRISLNNINGDVEITGWSAMKSRSML